jgi:ATP-dependent protease ClpP protease subunit
MPNWNDIMAEVGGVKQQSPFDIVRRKYLKKVNEITGRNVIIYYSGWLQKPGQPNEDINDQDKEGFMTTINGLDRGLGLDLILHTPGGSAAATESLVDYLRSMFSTNIRAFVPQLAMSAGTMVACACNSIFMGKESSLGPIDPQLNGVSAHGVIEEFEQARKEMATPDHREAIPLWQPIIAKYPPTFIGDCVKAVAWSRSLVKSWLESGMFAGSGLKDTDFERILEGLENHALTLAHDRHLSAADCHRLGLKILSLEENPALQDAVLSLHHACMVTFMGTAAVKIIENQSGTAFIQLVAQAAVTPKQG